MKKIIAKPICLLLMLAMFIPMMTFMANAAEITNLYDLSQVKCGTPQTTADANPKYNENYYCSGKIEVQPGDVITFGPVMTEQGYYLTSYTASGSIHTQQIKYANCKSVAQFVPGTEIVEWTVPANVTSIRMATAQLFYDSTLITKNQTFSVDDYYAYMDAHNINIDYLRKTTTAADQIVNIFPVSDQVFQGRVDANNQEITAGYRSTPMIPVKEGDIVYFGAADLEQGYHLALQDTNGKGTTTVNYKYMVQYDVIGNGLGIYAYRIRPGTGYVRIVASAGVYDDGVQLATLNQPFDAETYMKMFNITLPGSAVESTSPLYGKKMLFMGDSISYGSGDGVSPFRTGRAWAGRIADRTGAIVTNASVSGAKASFVAGDDKTKWLYTQFTSNKSEQFDIIVMHGGVNDARHKREIGKILDTDNSTELNNAKTTYIGGLQWLFYNVKKSQPDATLFFIANHRLDGHSTGYAKNMGPYFDMAKQLCEKYGIIFIDLYNNKELNDKLETTTTKYLPDTLHLNAAGYDIITPYIIEALEAGITAPVDPETTEPEVTDAPANTDEATDAPANTDEPTDAPIVTDEPTDAPAETDASATESKGCGGMIAGASVVIALLGTAIVFKKRG